MNDDLVRSYRHCRRLAREAASNFARMTWLLPPDQRRAMEALYAFARISDDLADGPQPLAEKRRRLAEWREQVDVALRQSPDHWSGCSQPILPAIADAVRRYQIPHDHLRQIIVGVEMDLDHIGFSTFAELRHYCLHVASAVGLVCLAIWGCRDERAIEPATDCGIAFQLTNILRDLVEDAGRGRMYLPREDLDRFGCQPVQIATAADDRQWHELVRFEAARARELFDSSAATGKYLAGSPRRMFRLMHATYRALLDKIDGDPRAVFARRLAVSRPQKAWLVLRTLLG
jgi:phytoene synthase